MYASILPMTNLPAAVATEADSETFLERGAAPELASPGQPPREQRLTPGGARFARATGVLGLIGILLFAGAAPASAETDSLSSQCISVNSVQRACAYNLYVNWGSGIAWRAGGQLVDTRADSWYNTVEIMLNRKWASNTGWIRVVRAGDWQTISSSTSGYDPTYGAWIRVCTVNPAGTKYCAASRYVTDNS